MPRKVSLIERFGIAAAFGFMALLSGTMIGSLALIAVLAPIESVFGKDILDESITLWIFIAFSAPIIFFGLKTALLALQTKETLYEDNINEREKNVFCGGILVLLCPCVWFMPRVRLWLKNTIQTITVKNPDLIDDFFTNRFCRYFITAPFCFFVAYYFEVHGKSGGATLLGFSWLAVAFVFAGLAFTVELTLIVLVIGFLYWLGHILFGAVAALPTSVALIIGAFIIASALKNK